MATLNAFSGDAFSSMSLTAAVNRLPYLPRLTQMLNIFSEKSIRTKVALVEEKLGKLALVSTAARGSVKDVRSSPRRRRIPFNVPHIPYFQTIMADDIQDIVAFGSETELMQLTDYVNEQQQGMKDDIDATQEWHRLGALKGVILDADASTTVYNLYTQFGITQTTADWTSGTDKPSALCATVTRAIANAMGDAQFGQIYALCGDSYFDAMAGDAEVLSAYDRWRAGEYLRMSQLGPEWYSVAMNGFEYQGIYFLNYRGQIGDTPFIPALEAYYLPTNTSGMFQEILAPADMMPWTNTLGQRYYSSQELLDHNKGVELHQQSNFLAMNTTPGAVIKSTVTLP
jgi:hypothetical protein